MTLTALSLQDFLLPAEGIVGSIVDDGVQVAAWDIKSRACAGELDGGADTVRSDSVTPIGYVVDAMFSYVVGFMRTFTLLPTYSCADYYSLICNCFGVMDRTLNPSIFKKKLQ